VNNKTETEVKLGTLYDFNKQAMLNEKPLKKSRIEKYIKPQLEDWFNWTLDGYAMLLCRERYDFTVFHLYEKQNPNPPAIAASELIEVLQNRGIILSMEKTGSVVDKNGQAWEIWIKIDDEAFVYYLFGCDDFVIEC